MYSRKTALALARRYRTCPPLHVMRDPSMTDKLQAHRAICAYCSGLMGDDSQEWSELAEGLAKILPSVRRATRPGPVAVGQLRWVTYPPVGWRDGRFFNPPCVLVLDVGRQISDEALVAQTYHDKALASPGDLILETPPGGRGAGELFVESWNIYTLRSKQLGPAVATLKPEVIAAIWKMEKNAGDLPDWAPLPRPMVDNDPRIFFRELEVEVGYMFAAAAAAELMAELEEPELELKYSSIEELAAEIGKILPAVTWPAGVRSLEQLLAAVQVAPEYYSLAASDQPEQDRPLKLICLCGGRVREVGLGRARIMVWKAGPEGLTISGDVPDQPEHRGLSRLLCFLETDESNLMVPDRLDWDPVDRTFVASFDELQRPDGRLHLALLFEIDDA